MKNIYGAFTMCTKCIISFSPHYNFRQCFHLHFTSDGKAAEEANVCTRLHSLHKAARAPWNKLAPSWLQSLRYFLLLSWCSLSVCWMNEIREYAIAMKKIFFNRLQVQGPPKFWTNIDFVCMCMQTYMCVRKWSTVHIVPYLFSFQ